MEQLYVFGTGNAQAIRCYNTCFAIKTEKGFLMVDGGGGNQILSILDKEGIKISDIRHLFVTHEHTDHILGVVWLVRMFATDLIKHPEHEDVTIYCHSNLADRLLTICELTLNKKHRAQLNRRIHIDRLADGDSRDILGLSLTFFDIRSTKAEQYGFETTLSDGQHLVFAGDEPAKEHLYDRIRGCDWLLHEAFCLYADRDIFHPYEKSHSTVLDVCRTAESLGVKKLILWHTEDSQMAVRKARYTEEGKSVFSGRLEVPDDGDILTF